jgi:ABC-2 type transport system permease protein
MIAKTNAVRAGLERGWTEFRASIKSPQDQGFYLFTALITLLYLFVRRNTDVPGTSLAFVTIALPSILGALVVFNLVIGRRTRSQWRRRTAPCSAFEPLPTA